MHKTKIYILVTCLVLVCIFTGKNLYAETTEELVNYFQNFNYDSVFAKGKNYFITIKVTNSDNKSQEYFSIVATNANAIFYKNKLQEIILLYAKENDDTNIWMLSNQTSRALRVTASQKISTSDYSIEDIARLNLHTQYRVVENPTVPNLLQAVDVHTAYPYIALTKISDEHFQVHYYDRNIKALKQIDYYLGTVGGYRFWSKTILSDLIYADKKPNSSDTTDIRILSVPQLYFTSSQMVKLFPYFHSMQKGN